MKDDLSNDDGVVRCPWAGNHNDYRAYHDQEWGRPVVDDVPLFEKLCLEGFQAGLSWLTILRKREAFRVAFADFNPEVVAGFGPAEVESLLTNPGIVRNRAKVVSTINNATRALEVAKEQGSLAAYLWSFEPVNRSWESGVSIPSKTPDSKALADDLKRRGWTFVGPTTVYAFMQAVGMVNDHLPHCAVRSSVEEQRAKLPRPVR
ncbi:MAG: DNA-3-methyladenine glycosylase I [Actinomycetota bacterium]|nr:DNA-3-methyladenine glycosylase I [Actinomycetota bacterium]